MTFTQIHRAIGSAYPRIAEIPFYGHSNNFTMLQMADMICSAVVFPMLIDVFGDYLAGSGNKHVSAKYSAVRDRYKMKIKEMQYRYLNVDGAWIGGLLVADGTGRRRSASLIFS